MNILYLHGLGGSPNGTKSKYCQNTYNAHSPSLGASWVEMGIDPEGMVEKSYQRALDALKWHGSRLIIGSSLGGGLAHLLIQRGEFTGGVIFLSSAYARMGLDPYLGGKVDMISLHSPQDTMVPFADSVELSEVNPDKSQLWVCNGDHQLHCITSNGLLDRAVSYFM